MSRKPLFICLPSFATLGLILAATTAEPAWWIVANFKSERAAIQPFTGETRMLQALEDRGIPSPDARHTAFIGSDPGSKRGFDLFVADVDPSKPGNRINVRALTTAAEHDRPTNPTWMPDSRGLLFLAGESENQQAWCVDTADPKVTPVRISDGLHPTSKLCVSSTGRIAYLSLLKREGKQEFHDLIVIDPLESLQAVTEAKRTTLVSGEHLTALAFSPDSGRLACAGINTMHVHDLSAHKASEVHYDAITPKLVNHLAWELAWRPDGKVIAALMSFAGGIAYEEGQGPPRMFAENKVFLIPADWSGPAPKYDANAPFPSPTIDNADDDKALPMPENLWKPGWVKVMRGRVNHIQWIATDQVPLVTSSIPSETK